MSFYSMEFTEAVPNEAIDGRISKENILTAFSTLKMTMMGSIGTKEGIART